MAPITPFPQLFYKLPDRPLRTRQGKLCPIYHDWLPQGQHALRTQTIWICNLWPMTGLGKTTQELGAIAGNLCPAVPWLSSAKSDRTWGVSPGNLWPPLKLLGSAELYRPWWHRPWNLSPLFHRWFYLGQSSQRKPSQGCCAPTFHGWHPQGQKDPVESGKGTCFHFLSWPPSGQRVPGEICWGSYSSLVHRWSPQDNTGPWLSGQGSSAS